ncbi:DUF3885 domain-containing protein [Labrenzia sp. PHM005]|uniref:DUF3885 domain-containing protein n=1 Tax=Labrenzia sp. PHM005 TaxID=2590016 RepID=UPI0011400A58|nr:DUF3885 domain-containing protein [Labrenzia sp. PHM005]QDG78833.1 DUF3885 domain-containing protein [Labrenzia sp. PHM005]
MSKKTAQQEVYERFLEVFGIECLPGGLFYQFEHSLRFELGDPLSMDQPIRRFLQAHRRSVKIAETVFDKPDNLYALVVGYGTDGEVYSKFKWLKTVFPDFRKKTYARKSEGTSDEVDEYWYFHPIRSRWEIAELLWLDLAREVPVEPSASNTRTYIVDFANAVILHAYDDRGLDLVSMQRSALLKPYKELRSWLLDYDIEAMDRAFGP